MDTDLVQDDNLWDIIETLMGHYQYLNVDGKVYLCNLMEEVYDRDLLEEVKESELC